MQHSQFLGYNTDLLTDPEQCKSLLSDRIHNIPVLEGTSESLFLLRTSPNVESYRTFWEAKKKRFWKKKYHLRINV